MPATAIHPSRPTGLSFRWSSNPAAGFVKAWVRTADDPDQTAPLLLDYAGPTLYVDQSCYPKLANYHSPFGQPSSVMHDRVIRGTTPGAVSLTALEGVPGW